MVVGERIRVGVSEGAGVWVSVYANVGLGRLVEVGLGVSPGMDGDEDRLHPLIRSIIKRMTANFQCTSWHGLNFVNVINCRSMRFNPLI